ncbi:MAG: aconitate hydratase AcnA [Chloroflexi bacterium]|nr:MAG: aconitate hydratase AcnA [Chloroflexota bacterium]
MTAMPGQDPYGARAPLLGVPGVELVRLQRLAETGVGDPSPLPVTVKVLLESLLRHAGERFVNDGDVEALAAWSGRPATEERERAFMPARVLMQDFTGVPAVVDLAAMRAAVARGGGDSSAVDPLVPADLVVDHSVQVDAFGSRNAYAVNIEREYERNRERYELLRWSQAAMSGFRVVPPGMGICHQVNLEYLAQVVQLRDQADGRVAFPDTLVGTDSHTTMVNGLSVLGWGVGGIEAEAVLLGQPLFLLTPVVVGVRFENELSPGVTATDLVLTLTQMLRKHGVVGKFVEFCGAGLSALTVADRATLANMSPEYGATAALFPPDRQTLRYLRDSGRDEELIGLVERYCKEQGLFRADGDPLPRFTELLELDLAAVEPSLAGPRRPQDRVALRQVWDSFCDVFGPAQQTAENNLDLSRSVNEGARVPGVSDDDRADRGGDGVGAAGAAALEHGSVVIAAITSCTNTSNPSVMLGAGLLARNAVERGLRVPGYVKTSMAPGSRVVTDYLQQAGLIEPLETLRFNLVGYGCTTCIGNSGPLPDDVARRIDADDLAVVAVLSGNRNFEGRIHSQVKASYLASPPLVVAYALAGTVHRDLSSEPLGTDRDGNDVYLRDIWPSTTEVEEVVARVLERDFFRREYSRIFDGDEHWQRLTTATGARFQWKPDSTYVREPPYFIDMPEQPPALRDIDGARVLAMLGDSITTDHISPAGSIPRSSPAGQYLLDHSVDVRDFNTYGARRGNHEVMVRGTFANIRLRNQLAGGREGGWTEHLPSGELLSIYDAAMHYAQQEIPLLVLAGKEYGSGSSRDWAAKGTLLLGVRAVLAESYERIHRSNLVGMGVLPLQFRPGESAATLGLTGRETYRVRGIADGLLPGKQLEVTASAAGGEEKRFTVIARVDSDTDVDYYHHGGVLNFVLRQLMGRG